jgi:SAM-dependent methyltransferase
MTWPADREYILPKRDMATFHWEGQSQARLLQNVIPDNATVLEYGCGVGRILRYVKAARRIGVDVSPSFLEEAARHDIEPLLTEDVTIDVPDDTVDFASSIMVFQHLDRERHRERIAEIRRVLKPDGRALIQFPRDPVYYGASYYYSAEEITGYVLGPHKVTRGALAGYADGDPGFGREWWLEVF